MTGPVRPAPMQAERTVEFTAWCNGREITDAEALGRAQTFDEAISAVAPLCPHKSAVFVFMADAGRGKRILRVYRIKRSSKTGRWRASYDGGPRVFEGAMVPELIGSIPVLTFQPEPPFDAFRDDPVGVDRSLVGDFRG